MSLTDDWKAGKLEDGLYYIRLEDDKTPIAELETWCRYDDEIEECYKMAQEFFGYPKNIISEVLSPVPSYDHFVELTEKVKELEKANKLYKSLADNGQSAIDTSKRLAEVIGHLRELLKDSIHILNEYKHYFDVRHYSMAENIIRNTIEVMK